MYNPLTTWVAKVHINEELKKAEMALRLGLCLRISFGTQAGQADYLFFRFRTSHILTIIIIKIISKGIQIKRPKIFKNAKMAGLLKI